MIGFQHMVEKQQQFFNLVHLINEHTLGAYMTVWNMIAYDQSGNKMSTLFMPENWRKLRNPNSEEFF